MTGFSIRTLFLISTAAVLFAPALADSASCERYGRHEPYREVRGTVVAADADWWGDRHIVVADNHSGCRVFVKIEDRACVPGKTFEGYGRLKSMKGDDFEATFRFFREPHAAVCG